MWIGQSRTRVLAAPDRLA
jgi:hypothetical protein